MMNFRIYSNLESRSRDRKTDLNKYNKKDHFDYFSLDQKT